MTRRWPIPRLAFAARRAGGAPAPDPQGERFRSLVLAHLDDVWTYARYLTRDDGIAEDVVQEAFLRAWRGQAGCRGDGRAWLMAILRHCWHDWLAARGRAMTSDVSVPAEPVEEHTPHSLLEAKRAAVELHAVLESLPEPFREALVLREIEELSYRDIAEVTGAPIGTVMSRLARGRAMLAALLLDDDEDGRAAKARTNR